MYTSTTEALQDLMNRGFLIYEEPSTKTWTIQKIATSYDPRPLLPVEGSFETDRIKGFESQASALEAAIEAIEHGPSEVRYAVEAMFNDGLGPKFKTIGEVAASTTMEADVQARDVGERYFANKKVKWDVRIRPVTDSLPNWV